ncbi:MAG: hypothetical protein ACLFN7_05845 [Candidatus Acetothermia bacterium]
MEVEFRVESEHLGWEDPAIEAAVDKYTNPLWPFGRRGKAQEKLEERQDELLEKNGVIKDRQLGITILKVDGVETEEEAWDRVKGFQEDLNQFYQDELGIDTPLEVSLRERSTVA